MNIKMPFSGLFEKCLIFFLIASGMCVKGAAVPAVIPAAGKRTY